MSVPNDRKYTKEHEWVSTSADLVCVGITDYAQLELGDVVFVDLPEVGKSVAKGDSVANVESVKAVSDVYAPLTGTIVEVNSALSESPELVNSSPYDDGWFVKIRPESATGGADLLDAAAYASHVEELSK